MIRNSLLAASLAMTLIAPAISMADDLCPPPWRGDPCSTFQEWDFSGPNYGPADNYNNPNGVPLSLPSPGNVWLPFAYGRQGVRCIGEDGLLQFLIPNCPGGPDDYKEIWVQVTWKGVLGKPHLSLTEDGTSVAEAEDLGTIPCPEDWKHTTFKFRLEDCPPCEYFKFSNPLKFGPICVDQIVIDTRCVPEPATMAGMGTALVAFFFRRKRR